MLPWGGYWLGYSFVGGDWWVEKVRFESFIYRFAGMDWLGGIERATWQIEHESKLARTMMLSFVKAGMERGLNEGL